MQTSPIVLAVDVLGNATLVNQSYGMTDFTSVRSRWLADDHTASSRNEMTLFRSAAKPNGNFRGVEKTAVKFTQDMAVPGADGVTTLTIPAICECSFSLPVGMTEAQKLELRERMAAALVHTFMEPLQKQLSI